MLGYTRAGWLNVLGQFATTGTLGYITVKHLGVMWMLANGHIFSNAETFLAYASEPSDPHLAWKHRARHIMQMQQNDSMT